MITAAAVTMGALIALAEVDRLVAAAIDGNTGISRTVGGVAGPFALGPTARDSWAVWRGLDGSLIGGVADWIRIHTAIDLLFIVGYAVLLFWLLHPVRDIRRHQAVDVAPVARRFLVVLVCADIVEDILLFVSTSLLQGDGVPSWWAWIVATVATVKWLAFGGMLLAALRSPRIRERVANALRRAGRAIWVQRLSFVVVAIVAVLALVPGPNIWDQLPDVQRGWDSGLSVLWASFSSVVVSFSLFVLGRRRSERAWATYAKQQVPEEPAAYGWWIVGPAVVALGAVVLLVGGREDLIDRKSVAVFICVPILLVALSWVLREPAETYPTSSLIRQITAGVAVAALAVALVLIWPEIGLAEIVTGAVAVIVVAVAGLLARLRRHRGWRLWTRPNPPRDRARAVDVVRAGDVLALGVILVAGLGLVRAFIAPTLLGQADSRHSALLVLGVLLVLGGPFVAMWVVARYVEDMPSPQGDGIWDTFRRAIQPEHRGLFAGAGGAAVRLRVFVAGVCVIVIVPLALLMSDPVRWSAQWGVVGTTQFALGGWAVAIGFLLVRLQHHRPLEVFRVFHLRANPVITLLATSVLIVSLAGGDEDLHGLRTPAHPIGVTPVVVEPQPNDLAETFQAWEKKSRDCVRTIEGSSVKIRPMVLIAASGGGIRAAVWTASALDQIGSAGVCGPKAVMLSSGVSGGSLGLGLAREEADGTAPARQEGLGVATERARRLAGPDALGVAVAGALVRDPVAALTGLRLPPNDRSQWRDRAGLMEEAWEKLVPLLAKPYDATVKGPGGALILNSAAAGLHCRVLISQIALEGMSLEDGAAASCHGATGLPAASLDLRPIGLACRTSAPSWATAIMLSARFPTVTPAGRVKRCDGQDTDPVKDLQLVDGGYAESSGASTIADLAPHIAQEVQAYNASSSENGPFIVPIVVLLENQPGADRQTPEPDLAPELFVPIAGLGAAQSMTATDTWLQRASSALSDPCRQNRGPHCADAVGDILVKHGVVIVAPVTRPSVDAPLGWTLSTDSLNRLMSAMQDQTAVCQHVQGYGCFKELISFLQEGTG